MPTLHIGHEDYPTIRLSIKTDTYIKVLGIIELTVNPLGDVYSQSFSPYVSMTDFEQAVMKSIKNIKDQ